MKIESAADWQRFFFMNYFERSPPAEGWPKVGVGMWTRHRLLIRGTL